MSDFTPTNTEVLARIRRDAAKAGKKVTVHGQMVWVHPKDVFIPANTDPSDKKYQKYFSMWAMEW